mmetsp:Transcript_38119/g.121430  ORF Transcript_38119/g.121430 Transcript_38119/m.121430 type:complete len:469 (+) Transcript_38119:3-1409(+)
MATFLRASARHAQTILVLVVPRPREWSAFMARRGGHGRRRPDNGGGPRGVGAGAGGPVVAIDGFLSRPDPRKEVEDGASSDGVLAYGVAAMQGWREGMEDAHIVLPDFDPARSLALFGVFDGHGGGAVARIVAERLPGLLRGLASYGDGRYEEALQQVCLQMDEFLDGPIGRRELRLKSAGDGPDMMGCTAIMALVQKGAEPQVWVANVGDSRCVLISGSKAIELSRDHGPNLPDEKKRIMSAGGWVNQEGRINGNLNLSRALGDFLYKKNKKLKPQQQIISGFPEIKHRMLGAADRFLILGCDGVWEQISSQGVADFLLRLVGPKRPLSKPCADFLDATLSPNPMKTEGMGCDNMSMVLVQLRFGTEAPAGAAAANGSTTASAVVAKIGLSTAAVVAPSDSTCTDGIAEEARRSTKRKLSDESEVGCTVAGAPPTRLLVPSRLPRGLRLLGVFRSLALARKRRHWQR